MAIDFSFNGLLDTQKCYDYLVDILHHGELHCPNGHSLENARVHKKHRAPIITYQCKICGRCFNVFTATVLQRIKYNAVQIIQILRGIVQGETTFRLAREIGVDRKWLLVWRNKLQRLVLEGRPRNALPDSVVESDEMYQNAGEKGDLHDDPSDPPRRRANKNVGHGTWDNDRPPILGIVGRESGEIRLEVCERSTREELVPKVVDATCPGAIVNTDEWQAYLSLDENERQHVKVSHKPGAREWARDDDGDGIREVHCNTMEGIWTGLRNFLRRFRGVHKKNLGQYVAIFERAHNLKTITLDYLRMILGVVALNAL